MAGQYPFIVKKQNPAIRITSLVDLIRNTQEPSGAIPWSPGDKTDPWDHVESAMGLSIGGAFAEARRAFEWLGQQQLPDGSWYAAYKNGQVADRTRESNHAAYIAVGLYHYLCISGDIGFVDTMWPTVCAAMDFTLSLQAKEGEIYWALSSEGRLDAMALLTGNSSIALSLRCALALADRLGDPRPGWQKALERLLNCLRTRPHCFNMTKARFSMDWFYPVLCGVVRGAEAGQRLQKQWKKFVVQHLGVRCVSDQPWVTIAESSELVLALAAMGNALLARIVFSWISDHIFDDGTYWCGFTFPDMVLWPQEKISWTNAVVLMAADALFNLTPAGNLFDHNRWPE